MQEQIDSEQVPGTEQTAETDARVQTDSSDASAELDLIAKLQEENAALNDSLIRTLAESQNIQRRLRSQMEQDRKYAIESLIKDLIPVLDNFGRSIAAAERGASPEAVLDGVVAIEKSLRRALEQYGLVQIEAVGKPFDPEVHEAVATVETEDIASETVTDELEIGYRLHERVVRPSKVRVSTKPGQTG